MLAEGPGFRLLDALLEVGSEGATREHLLRKAELSVGTFYKKIKPLIQAGLIKEQGHRYYLPLDSAYVFRFKLWRDFDRIYDLSETVRASVLGVLEEALEVLAEGLECLWLVGSVARAEHTVRSDIDFLAIVHDVETHFSPREGVLPVQWVPMTQETFSSKLRQGDEFAVSAIRYGVLLHDGGMARDFYQVPLNEPSSAFFREKALVVERFRSRFFESLAVDDLDQARADLASMAQTVIRLIFQRLGEHPGGKPDLLRLLDIYFGPQMRMDFWAAITSPQKSSTKDSLIRLHRSVSDYYEQFAAKAGLLEKVTESLLRGQSAEFESALGTVLSELFEGLQKSDGGAIDFLLAFENRKLLLEAKTLTGGLAPSQLRQLVKQCQSWEKDSQQQIVLVVNSLRQVPVLERTGLSAVQDLAQELGVVVLYSTQLLRAYHILHLEENHREAVASLGIQGQLIISDRLKPPLLQDAVLDKLRAVEVILDDWDSDDSEVDAWDFEGELELTINSFFVKDPDLDGLLDISFSYSVSIVAQVTLVTHEAWDQEESRYLIEDKDSGIIEQTLTETGTAVIKCPKQGELKVEEVDLHDLDQIVLSRSLFRANHDANLKGR